MKNLTVLLNVMLLALMSISTVLAQKRITVRPAEINDVLINPGMGFTTFQMFNGDNLPPNVDALSNPSIKDYQNPKPDFANDGHPMTSMAYFRILWNFIEPEARKYNWDYIDELLGVAHRRNQTLMLRIAPYKGKPGTDVPDWYRDLVGNNRDFAHEKWVVDPEDPQYVQYYGAMIRALGARYDGHPDLESVDVSIVGWAGENGGAELLSDQTMMNLLDPYIESFRKTPLTVLIHGKKANDYITSKGVVGWRQDCLGDLDFWAEESDGWSHMYDYYPETIIAYGMQNAWKKAAVAFEVCSDMGKWKTRHGYDEDDVNYIIDQSLKWHISTFNNKSSKIPEEWQPLVERWQKKMGYRFALRKFTYPETLKPGAKLWFTSWWENKGVAPCYKKFTLALRLTNKNGTQLLPTEADITKWLPGDSLYNDSVFLPMDMPKGEYELQIAIVDPLTSQSKIKLASEGINSDGWYSLGLLSVNE